MPNNRRSGMLADHLLSTYRNELGGGKYSKAVNPESWLAEMHPLQPGLASLTPPHDIFSPARPCPPRHTSSSKSPPPKGSIAFANSATNCQSSVQTHCQWRTFCILTPRKGLPYLIQNFSPEWPVPRLLQL